jgi:hypothetical protein
MNGSTKCVYLTKELSLETVIQWFFILSTKTNSHIQKFDNKEGARNYINCIQIVTQYTQFRPANNLSHEPDHSVPERCELLYCCWKGALYPPPNYIPSPPAGDDDDGPNSKSSKGSKGSKGGDDGVFCDASNRTPALGFAGNITRGYCNNHTHAVVS